MFHDKIVKCFFSKRTSNVLTVITYFLSISYLVTIIHIIGAKLILHANNLMRSDVKLIGTVAIIRMIALLFHFVSHVFLFSLKFNDL